MLPGYGNHIVDNHDRFSNHEKLRSPFSGREICGYCFESEKDEDAEACKTCLEGLKYLDELKKK